MDFIITNNHIFIISLGLIAKSMTGWEAKVHLCFSYVDTLPILDTHPIAHGVTFQFLPQILCEEHIYRFAICCRGPRKSILNKFHSWNDWKIMGQTLSICNSAIIFRILKLYV